MKKIISSFIALCLISATLELSAQQQYHRCSAMEYLDVQLQQDPGLAQRMQMIEQQTQQYIQNNHNANSRSVVTIPVVVHVLYKTSAQNISDALIVAQIDQLNKDFARLNSDVSSTPSVFAGVAANTNVQFCLAQRSPTGTVTTGIIRKQTTTTSFNTNDNVKKSSKGGDDAWPSSSYLNLWVCNLGNSLLGYAQFPGGSASTDGVVVLYSSVGSRTTPGTASPYNYGRTATHEVGHWLNLYHIWGDDGTGCNGSDNVGDTPNQGDENYGCPTFPTISCSNGPNGDMFMNYMDYTDDGCMNMFTAGQATRMNALFASNGSRVSLLNSLGCVPVGTACGVASGLSTGAITTSSASFSWSAVSGAASYNVHYRVLGSSTWTNATATSNILNVSGLAAGTNYEWQVQTVCSGSTAAYSASANFTTSSGPSCGVPSGLTSSGIGNSGATLSWASVSGATSYNLQWKLGSSSTWTIVSNLSASPYALTGLAACSSYQFQVQANCSGTLSAYSGAASFSTTGCTVSYCASAGTNSSYEYINRVAIGTIDNTSGNNGGYANFTALSTNLTGGAAATITLTPGFSGTTYTEYWTIYIDYNRNGSFADAGEKVTSGYGSAGGNLSFTVPTTALNGATRMRVQMKYSSYATNSCTTFTYGEVEDYTVNITGNAQREMNNAEDAVIDPEINEVDNLFSLYPNPAKDEVKVEFLSRGEGSAKLIVYNLTGQKMLWNEIAVREGANVQRVNTNTLSDGVYIFEVQNNGETLRQKFTIAK